MRFYTLILILVGAIFAIGCSAQATNDDLAKCLTTNGMTFYGAFWCPHCANMKKEFGDSIKYVQYVECDPRGNNPQPQLCEDQGVDGYPTFIFADGSRLQGEQPLSSLAAKAGCPPPALE